MALTQGDIDAIAAAVWEKPINGVVAGSFGETAKQLAFQEHIYVNVNEGVSGTAYPNGTHLHPVNNIADAVTIGLAEGIFKIIVAEDVTIQATDVVDNFIIKGTHATKSQITVLAGASTQLVEFIDCSLTGTLSGPVTVRDSRAEDLVGFEGILHQVMVTGSIKLAVAVEPSVFLSCYCGPSLIKPEIDFNGSGTAAAIRNYSGGLKLVNKTGSSGVDVNLLAGVVAVDGTVTNGIINIDGAGVVIDNSTGSASVLTDGLVNKVDIATQVRTELTPELVDITNILAVVTEVRKYEKNRTKIDENAFTLTVFDDDGTTPIKVFDLKDRNGVASFTEIFERLPI